MGTGYILGDETDSVGALSGGLATETDSVGIPVFRIVRSGRDFGSLVRAPDGLY